MQKQKHLFSATAGLKPTRKKKLLSQVALFIASLLVVQFSLFSTAFAADNLIPESSKVAQADAVVPSDIENLKATAGDKKITLSWDTATDNVGVTGYKIYYGTNSVTNDGGSYTNGPIDAKNVISYDVTNLTNGTKYYFAVTAYDAAGNESTNYSLEVSATPTTSTSTSANDTVAPKVVKAESLGKTSVRVTFSEEITLPTANPQSAFSAKEDITSTALEIQKAAVDPMDFTHKSVLLTTADQKVGRNYILTAGIEIKDKAGNPIVSGTSDTGSFVAKDTPAQASDPLKPAPESSSDNADKTAPTFVNVTALDSNTVEVTFSEPVVLKTDARENFIITEEQNVANVLAVKKVTQGTTGMVVVLTTDPQKAINYNLIAVDVSDQAGNKMSIENNATSFKGQAAPAPTTEQPSTSGGQGTTEVDQLKPISEGAKNFMAKVMENLVVRLSWAKASENLADIANFVVYMSTDRGKTYGEGVVLDPTTLSYDFSNLTPGMMYYFKLTTRNNQGKESQGLITSLTLPGTGPELGVLLLGSLGAGKLFQRKKKMKNKK